MAPRTKISPTAYMQAYQLAKAVYDKELKHGEALTQSIMPSNTLKAYLSNYRNMRLGIQYQRTMNAPATRYFLERISEGKDGATALAKALSALDQHIRYYNTKGKGSLEEQRAIHEEFAQRLRQGTFPEHELQKDIREIENSSLPPTEKERLINARMGQGQFREAVICIEKQCRITGLKNTNLLIASHIKPWNKCNDKERLDGYNGLLLSPHIDRLFDRGHLSFAGNGDMLLSDQAKEALQCWGISPKNVGNFHPNQKKFLAWHNLHVYKSSRM
jgi:hypothetical protein